MTTRELLTARDNIRKSIGEIDRAIHEIAVCGFASASITSGGASKSYTRANLGDLRAYRAELAERLSSVLSALSGNTSGMRRVMVVRG